MSVRVALCVLFALVARPALAAPPATLHGTVVDRSSQEPVVGAVITTGNDITASGDDGTFTLTPPAGAHDLAITADWINPARVHVTLAPGDNTITVPVDPA